VSKLLSTTSKVNFIYFYESIHTNEQLDILSYVFQVEQPLFLSIIGGSFGPKLTEFTYNLLNANNLV